VTLPPRDRLERFYRILNIPIELGWQDALTDDKKNWYYYLFSLGALSRADLLEIYQRRRPLSPNRSIDTVLANIDYLSLQGQPRAIADIGSGWGLVTLWLLVSGVERVVSIGDPSRVAWIARVAEEARRKGLLPPQAKLEPVAKLIGPNDTQLFSGGEACLDLCLLHDTLEHIAPRTLPALLRLCQRALRPGGRFISVSHNSDNPGVMRSLEELWERIERDEYRPKRVAFIQARLPEAPIEEVERLADQTRGLDRGELDSVLSQRGLSSVRDRPPAKRAPMDIDCDVVEEGYTDRSYVIPLLRQAGFSVRAYPFVRTRRRTAWLQGVVERLPEAFFRLHVLDERVVYEATANGRATTVASER
jgi:SAM-dependent methyltransferase